MSVTTTTACSEQQDWIVVDESSINSLDFVTFGRLLLRSADNTNQGDEEGTKRLATLRCRLSNHSSIEETSSTEDSSLTDAIIHDTEIKPEDLNRRCLIQNLIIIGLLLLFMLLYIWSLSLGGTNLCSHGSRADPLSCALDGYVELSRMG